MSTVFRAAAARLDPAPTDQGATPDMASGIVTRRLAQGDASFYVQEATFPPEKVVHTHSHSHSEFLYVLSGSCTMTDGILLECGDGIVIAEGETYGFEVGPQGMRFLQTRFGRARTTVV